MCILVAVCALLGLSSALHRPHRLQASSVVCLSPLRFALLYQAGIGRIQSNLQTMAKKGLPMESIGAAAPDALARATLEALPNGPVFHWDEVPGSDDSLTSAHKRRERAQWVTDTLNMFYG